MKITKGQIRKIIREEQQKSLKENNQLQSVEERLFEAIDEYIMILDESMGYDIPDDLLKAELLNFIDGYFDQVR